jgi:hypothetical protein
MRKMSDTNYTDPNIEVTANSRADYYVYDKEVKHYGT